MATNHLKLFIMVAALGAFFILGTTFMVSSMGSLDSNKNVSTAYNETYETTKDLSITTMTFTKFLPPIFGVIAIVIALAYIRKIT